MNWFSRLTTVGRILFLLVLFGLIALVLHLLGVFSASGDGQSATSSSKGGLFSNKKDDAVTLVVNSYCGFSPIVWGNGGTTATDDSYFNKNYGLKLNIKIMDDFDAARAALKSGDAQIEYCTWMRFL